jgi:hypothetical protein
VATGQKDLHHVRVVVQVSNESHHSIDVYSYPKSCAVPQGNPTVFVLDQGGRSRYMPTLSGASCPYPGSRSLAPGRALRRTVTVDLQTLTMWIQGMVILSGPTGLQHTIQTNRVRLRFNAVS